LTCLTLIIENKTDTLLWGPQNFHGNLIDSGEYRREISFQSPGDTFYRDILLPNIRVRIFAYALLPLNQTPVSIELGLDNSIENFTIDAQNPKNDLVVPFSEPPNNIPTINQGAMTYKSNDYRIKLFNFRFMPNQYSPIDVSLYASGEVENFGGYDLRFDKTADLGFIMIDNNGNYRDEFHVYYFDDFIAPGMTKSQDEVFITTFGTPHKDFEWIWVLWFDKNTMSPIAQVKVEPTR